MTRRWKFRRSGVDKEMEVQEGEKHLASLEPAGDAVEVKGVVAPRNRQNVRCMV